MFWYRLATSGPAKTSVLDLSNCGFSDFVSLLFDEAVTENLPRRQDDGQTLGGNGRGRLGSRRVYALAVFWVAMAGHAAEPEYELYLPGQDAASALEQLAAQTGAITLFPYDLAEDRKANSVIGRFTLPDALALLLEGTGLSGDLSEKLVITVSAAEAADRTDEETSMEPKKTGLFAALFTAFAGSSEVGRTQEAPPAATEEVIVTAQRREEALLDTPVTVTALGGDLIERQNVREMTDLVPLVPGLQIEPDSSRTSIRIRGLSTADGTATAENIAALHVDNIYISHRDQLAGYFFDIARVEVLQGPQGTLYGRNAAAGSINIISNRPSDEMERWAEIEFGSNNYARIQGGLNIPISDTFAIRGAFQGSKRDGYYESGIDDHRDLYARLSGQWDPTDRVSLYAKFDFGDSWDRGSGQGLLGTIDRSNPDNWTVTWFDEDEWFDDRRAHPLDPPRDAAGYPIDLLRYGSVTHEKKAFTSELTVDVTDNLAAIVNVGHIEDKMQNIDVNLIGTARQGYGAGVVGGLPGERVVGRPWTMRTVDARLQGTIAGQLDWTAGYFYWDDDTNEVMDNSRGAAAHVPIALAESRAVYGQFTWTPPARQRLRLTAGVRRTEDWKQWDFQLLLNNMIYLDGSDGIREREWNNTDYKLGLAWDLGENSLLYTNYSTGFRSGSWFFGAIPQYDPEFIDAYEVGWKGRLLDDRLELSANVYYYDFTDMTVQFSAFDTIQQEDALAFFNLGKAESYGFNVSGTYLLGDRDALSFNLDYLGSEILEFDYDEALAEFKSDIYVPNPTFDWTGLPFPNTTPWRLTVGWDRTVNLASGATFSSRVQGVWSDERYYAYRDDTLVQPKFDGRLIDSHLTLDWHVNYRPPGSEWFVGAYVSNITDEIVPESLGTRTPLGTLAGEPVPNGSDAYLSGNLRPGRRYGIRFGYDF